MGSFLKKLLLVIYTVVFLTNYSVSEEKTITESQLIRRAFLDVLQVPPTPAELDWYVTYNNLPYNTAIDWIINRPNASYRGMTGFNLKWCLLSEEYKNSPPTKLKISVLENIIKYQCGNVNLTTREADKRLIQISVIEGEDKNTDVIDYLSLCLMARVTNVTEINHLVKTFKSQPTEEMGYLNVLNELKTYKDFQFK